MKTFKIWYTADGGYYVTSWPDVSSKQEMLVEFWNWAVLQYKKVHIERVEEIK